MHDHGYPFKQEFNVTKPKTDNIADYFIFYLQNDTLGRICNLHLALSDMMGTDGPKDEDCLKLAHLQSIAVDFAKHGEPVSKGETWEIEEQIKAWPDFFEKSNQRMYESQGILGQLYREISNREAMEKLIQFDYEMAILCLYELDLRIVNQTKNMTLMCSYLQEAYLEIVKPMNEELKKLMLKMNFGCEAEIFASDLRFKMFDDSDDNIY